ncbi:MAG TPA: GTP 3',8-cyclase MoaA [Acidimicrobiia bacterium]|jgi:cyclic pyranopterin phosphate synthase|nr:GTP 3',8-cyclase MoaA [Acidimicrobiia bacterium]
MTAPSSNHLADTMGRPLRDLRISVTDRCNFRCPYCMPAELYGEEYTFLPRSQILSFEEIERLTRIFVDVGVAKIRLTGGEPLVRAHLPELVGRLAAVDPGLDLTLTTNGALLAPVAEDLAKAGLRRVTVSLDSLDAAVFTQMCGRDNVHPDTVLEAIDAAAVAGLTPVKINCVVQRGVNDHTIADLARHFRGTGHIVRFIEFMDVGTLNGWDLSQVVTAAEIVELIGAEVPLEPVGANYVGEVAKRWRYVDGSGEIGVISSVSQPFCGDCSRARLSTEGQLVTCLFAAGGLDLRGPMRDGASDEDLRALIVGCWSNRRDRYSEERSGLTISPTRRRRVEMFQVGG